MPLLVTVPPASMEMDTVHCSPSITRANCLALSAKTAASPIPAAWLLRATTAFFNSADRGLALDTTGTVVRDTGMIAGLNPGGGVFGPDGRYYAGLRSARTILALSPDLNRAGEHILSAGVVPFPRGFGFDAAGRLFLASGIGPDGKGDDAILASVSIDHTRHRLLVHHDPELSPLDLIVATMAMSSYPARFLVRRAQCNHERPRISRRKWTARPRAFRRRAGCVPQTARVALRP